MFALRFASLFLLAASFVSASPTPAAGLVAVEKRASTADVQAVFNTLKDSTDTILPQINALVSGGTATDDTVTPLIKELTSAVYVATASLNGMQVDFDIARRQSDDEIAILVAGIVTDITNALDGLAGSAASIPALTGLLTGLDSSLHEVLLGLETLLAGVLNLVANLLVDVAALLRSLALGLTLTALGFPLTESA
ncbi:hypothetical protein C8R43DRAFT_874035 [Mycena crocata]|nr:hypothetical protein C8R43DRAFT_874035 [Mycena crocata]